MPSQAAPQKLTLADSLRRVLARETSDTEREILRFHSSAPRATVTMAQVAAHMGWSGGVAANGAYGRLAKKVAVHMNAPKPKEGFWSFLLLDWAPTKSGAHQRFVLRPEVAAAVTDYLALAAAKTSTGAGPG